MSGFSSLGGNKEHQQQQSDNSSNSSLFLFKNEEIYNKGFELWQQYNQHHHPQRAHHHHRSIQDVDFFSVGPSRRNTEANNNHSNNGLITGDDPWNCYSYRYRSSSGFGMLRQAGRSSGGVDQGINCQDCGNQAKKDCVYMRCRTCCKSRGFECQTHVKSTWVPAAKRRDRQQQQQLSAMNQQQQEVRGETSKRLRESSSLVAYDTTSSRLAAKTSGFELGHFPAEVNSPAVFRCVRVSTMDDPKEHLAYQTSVNISGRVFKGILYDQGPENRYYNPSRSIGGGGESSHHPQRPRDLISIAATTTTTPSASTAAAIAGSSVNVITNSMVNDPSSSSSIYPTPLSAFMAGTQFFPPPRS